MVLVLLLQVLVATSTLAWGVNTPAHLVIIKGTEYFDAPTRYSSSDNNLMVAFLSSVVQKGTMHGEGMLSTLVR